MDELWKPPGPAAAAAMRSVCEALLARAGELAEVIAESAVVAQAQPELLSDASLLAEDRALNRSDLLQWLTANIQHPGSRVEPYISPRTVAYIGDLVSRGIAPQFGAGWRAALVVGWRHWLESCLDSIDDRAVLTEVLEVSTHSLMQYALDSVSILREVSLSSAMGNAGADALEMIQLIAGGTPLSQDFAEDRLGYRLERRHTAVVVWVDDPDDADAVDEAVTALRDGRAARTTLVARASAAARWVWLSEPNLPDLDVLEPVVTGIPHVRASVGRTGAGLDGFRSSYQDALSGQALLTRLGSERRFIRYAELELVDALTQDRESAARFVANTLGPLADADETLRQALLTYVQCGFSATRAAARLYLHRNTIERRVSKADELSVVKLDDSPVHVSAALLVLDLVPDLLPSSPRSQH